jgi:hypothetical protein
MAARNLMSTEIAVFWSPLSSHRRARLPSAVDRAKRFALSPKPRHG